MFVVRTVLVRRENGGCSSWSCLGWLVGAGRGGCARCRAVFSVGSSSGRAVRTVPVAGMVGCGLALEVPRARAAATGQALAAARPWETPGPARPAGAPARRAGLRCPRRGSPAVRTVCPRVGPSGGERALGQVDAISRTWTRFRPGKRQPERRSPNQEHVHQPLGTLTRPRARSPTQEHVHLRACGTGCPVSAPTGGRGRGEGGWSGRSWAGRPTTRRPTAAASHRRRRRRPGGVVPQGPAARQHRSRGPPGRRRRRANPHPGRRPPSTQPPTTSTTRHARHQAEDPQPNHPEKHNQDTSPTVTGPTTSTARSHDKQVPFSRAISTVLTEGRAAAPTSPHPAPTRRGQTVRLQASSEPSSAGSPSQGRPAPLPGVSARFASSASASPDQPPALGSQRTGWSRRGRPRTPDPARHRPRPGRPLASATGTSTARPSPPRPSRPRRVDHGLVLVRAAPLRVRAARARAAPTASHPCQAGGRRPPPRPGRPRPRQASRSRPRSRRRPDPASSPPP